MKRERKLLSTLCEGTLTLASFTLSQWPEWLNGAGWSWVRLIPSEASDLFILPPPPPPPPSARPCCRQGKVQSVILVSATAWPPGMKECQETCSSTWYAANSISGFCWNWQRKKGEELEGGGGGTEVCGGGGTIMWGSVETQENTWESRPFIPGLLTVWPFSFNQAIILKLMFPVCKTKTLGPRPKSGPHFSALLSSSIKSQLQEFVMCEP